MMAFFTLYCTICALRTNVMFCAAFFFLMLTFMLVAASEWVTFEKGKAEVGHQLQIVRRCQPYFVLFVNADLRCPGRRFDRFRHVGHRLVPRTVADVDHGRFPHQSTCVRLERSYSQRNRNEEKEEGKERSGEGRVGVRKPRARLNTDQMITLGIAAMVLRNPVFRTAL